MIPPRLGCLAVAICLWLPTACSSRKDVRPHPIPYWTDWAQVREPYAGGVVDTTNSILRLGGRLPTPTSPDPGRPIILSLTSNRITISYHSPSGGYIADVVREFRTPEEERLLRIAEATYPLREAFGAADSAWLRSLPSGRHLWWLGETFDGVPIPYAVTLEALRYYLDLTRIYGQGGRPDSAAPRMLGSTLAYSAVIHKGSRTLSGDAFRDIRVMFVVELRLKWESYCGNRCAVGFTLDRTVALDHGGRVLAVFGDRRPSVIVS